MKKVITIEPAKQVSHKVDLPSFTKRRVAGYARVSTDHEDQTTSYEAQMKYYTDHINSRSDWEFVKMYSDEGISGTNTKARIGFQRMVEDALDGKIDLILTKSVSRFARNTVDSLSTVRKLKEAGVEIYFEKENIWTFDSKGELLITIMSSLAQEESRSISENVTWGRRRQLAEGQVTFSYSQVLGFKKSDTGGFEIDHEEAKIVRYIFHQVLLGNNPNKIARELTAQGIPTPQGKRQWSYGTVKRMLRNEKYKGDALLQKSFTTDFLLFCCSCGSAFGSKVWHSTSKYKRTIYQCNAKYRGEHKCQTPHVTEEEIKAWFLSAMNQLLNNREEIIANTELLIEMAKDTTPLENKIDDLEHHLETIRQDIEDLVDRNSREAQNQELYQEQYDILVTVYQEKQKELQETRSSLEEQKSKRISLDGFIQQLKEQDDLITDFNQELWQTSVERLDITVGKKISLTFKNGVRIDL
ncbi:recombinase family protein [Streptococcus suis]|uniref:recombinase family protein n=1 Tax=Streptococcus suis TaxID=1307 RepID=UPI00192D3592|nr:recombinase family protein [Streptococcus suis]MBL6440874.1 recombinase family protein [Streptococcus suis]